MRRDLDLDFGVLNAIASGSHTRIKCIANAQDKQRSSDNETLSTLDCLQVV